MAKKQTAGRDILGEFAPKFAELNHSPLVLCRMAQSLVSISFRKRNLQK